MRRVLLIGAVLLVSLVAVNPAGAAGRQSVLHMHQAKRLIHTPVEPGELIAIRWCKRVATRHVRCHVEAYAALTAEATDTTTGQATEEVVQWVRLPLTADVGLRGVAYSFPNAVLEPAP